MCSGTDIHAPGGIRTHYPSKRSAVDPRLRPRGHWDRHSNNLTETNSLFKIGIQEYTEVLVIVGRGGRKGNFVNDGNGSIN